MPHYRLGSVLLALFFLVALASAADQRACQTQLYAGISGRVNQNPTSEDVELSFILLNDSDEAVDVGAGSWTLVVDGVPLKDSGMLFGNGPEPSGGYRILRPGKHYEFSKAFSVAKYFSGPGKHEIYWKGHGFQSRTLTVVIEHQ
jgi:hypothetical protein